MIDKRTLGMPKVDESFVFHSSYGFYYLWDKAVYISKGIIKKQPLLTTVHVFVSNYPKL